ncbi:MAG: gliding motility-associated ABC transporter substrate-binding protein GldG [Flavobacterium sp.]|nr:gliding motility-associated ABC transporter substrate-binding protein GldG [Flavobacterium sp.]
MRTYKKDNLKKLFVTIGLLILVNIIGHFWFHRFDLTKDKRYTLSPVSLDIIEQVKEPLYVDVFLEGQFPGEFKRLQTETRQLLEEFKAYNTEIEFRFINPVDDSEGMEEQKRQLIYDLFKLNGVIKSEKEEKEIKQSIAGVTDLNKAIQDTFLGNGMLPINVTLEDKGKQTQEVVFPWAIATYKNRTVKIPLLKNLMGASTQNKVESSVQHMEYAFANAFNIVTNQKEKKVAVIKGNGEMHDLLMADFIKQVREQYYIGTFTLDSVANQPAESAAALKKYDLAIIAKPKEKFSDAEKQVLDQFVINGGKTLWLMDAVNIEMDSLYNENGATLAYPNDVNLNDMFFKYGFRIEPELIKDEQATPIKLATGQEGSGTQYTQYFWKYAPLIYPSEKDANPIVKNLDGIKFDFANPIDVLQNDIKKTVLLKSSPFSKPIGTPVEVKLNMVSEEATKADYANSKGGFPVALLLEGKFSSVFKNRVKAFDDRSFKDEGVNNKMIVISDGDVIRNQLDKNYQPLELGYDKWVGAMYGNKEFAMNCVNYLLDDNGLISIRSKNVSLAALDKTKVYDNYTQSQIITIGVPLIILLVFGLLFTFLRKRKYSR